MVIMLAVSAWSCCVGYDALLLELGDCRSAILTQTMALRCIRWTLSPKGRK